VTQVTVLSILMGPIGVPLGIWGSVSRVSPWEMERATVNGMPLDTTYKYLPEGYRSPKQRWSDRPLEEAVGVPSRLVDLAVSVALDPHGVQVIPEVGLAADMPGSDAWSRAVDSYQERFAGKAGSGR